MTKESSKNKTNFDNDVVEIGNRFQSNTETPKIFCGGSRCAGISRKSFKGKPLITVITVTFNSDLRFENTIESVLSQTYDNIEYIIIDGGSTNGTIDIVKKYSNKLDYWISEPDNGIYDAMNKGIKTANGECVVFLNSDDIFESNNVVEYFKDVIIQNPEIDMFYGKVAIYQNDRLLRYIGKKIEERDYYHPSKHICHQGIFFRKKIFDTVGLFDTKFPGGISDYIWLVNFLYFKHGKFLFVDKIVSRFSQGGYSEKYIWKAYMAHLCFANRMFPVSVRLKYYLKFPEYFIKFKILRLHEDTPFRRFYRKIKFKILDKKTIRNDQSV